MKQIEAIAIILFHSYPSIKLYAVVHNNKSRITNFSELDYTSKKNKFCLLLVYAI